MGSPPTGAPDRKSSVAPTTGQIVRILVILGVNLALVITVTVLASAHGSLPDLNAGTLLVQLLPVSAAMGLVLVCRRLDLALPVLFVAAAAMRANPWAFAGDVWLRMLILCGLAAGVAVVSTLVTWYGRIASALWTVLLAGLLWHLPVLVKAPPLFGSAGWPWTAAVAASMGFLLVAAAVLGLSRLVAPPSSPPIFHTGSHGLAG
ncbi:MAG: hypothetical protein WBD52_12030, partial [Phycisphaerae bacterium]